MPHREVENGPEQAVQRGVLLPAAILYPCPASKGRDESLRPQPLPQRRADPPPKIGGCFCPSGGGESRVYTPGFQAGLASCLAVITVVRRR